MTSLKLLKEYLKTTVNLEFYIQRKCPSETKTFSNKQNLREFINSKLELQKKLLKALQVERIWYQTNLDVHKEMKNFKRG